MPRNNLAESTCEAEFVACSPLSREVCWCRNFLSEIFGNQFNIPTEIYLDNQSAIRLVRNDQVHSKIKQLDIRLFAVRERQEEGHISVQYVSTDEQLTDIMTKPLPATRFTYLRNLMGLVLLTIMLSLLAPTSCFKFYVGSEIVPFTSSPQKKLMLKVTNPCPVVNRTEYEVMIPAKNAPLSDLV